MPDLSYHLVDIDKYKVKLFGRLHLSLESSRGCSLRCQFCYNTRLYGGSWRSQSVERTLQRVKRLVSQHGAEGIIFTDDNFFVDKPRAIQILQRIRDELPGLSLSKVDGTADVLSQLTDQELALLRDAGCKLLLMGLESGAPRVQKMLGKRLDEARVLELNQRVARFGMLPGYFFMVGYPTETLNELRERCRDPEVRRQAAQLLTDGVEPLETQSADEVGESH